MGFLCGHTSVVSGTAGNARRPIRVLLADDHEYFRQTLRGLLEAADDVEVVAECTDGDEVAQAVADTQPDVAILDVSMPRVSGIEAARRLRDEHPEVAVLILSSGAASSTIARAADAGASGYLVKGQAAHWTPYAASPVGSPPGRPAPRRSARAPAADASTALARAGVGTVSVGPATLGEPAP